MWNLMKYEFRNQMLSKGIILIAGIVIELFFLIGYAFNNENLGSWSIWIMRFAFTLSLFYLFFEPATKFSEDLSRKQGFLLFMTPNSTYRILGAKILAGVINTAAGFLLYISLFKFNQVLLSIKLNQEIYIINDMFNAFGDEGFGLSEFLFTISFVVALGMALASLAMLSNAICHALSLKGRLVTIISVLLFVVLFLVEVYLTGIFPMQTYNHGSNPRLVLTVLMIMLLVIPAFINYLISSILMEKKINL